MLSTSVAGRVRVCGLPKTNPRVQAVRSERLALCSLGMRFRSREHPRGRHRFDWQGQQAAADAAQSPTASSCSLHAQRLANAVQHSALFDCRIFELHVEDGGAYPTLAFHLRLRLAHFT
jgi:hypothetical protein